MSETVVHLVRHGEVFNPEKILYGRLPGYVLSERGHAMAERVAAALAGHPIAAVIASPLERAQQTAEPIATSHGLEIGVDERIIEADNIFEGKRVAVGDGALRQPAAWRHLWNPIRPSWGEPYDQLAARMSAAIEDARQRYEGAEAVLVSHQLPVWVARLAAEGRRLWHHPANRQCSLASVTSLTFDGARLAAITYTEPARDLLTSDDLSARGA